MPEVSTHFFKLSNRTYKSGLQVPAPAVVEETHDDGSGKVPDQDGQVGDLNVRHGQLHKLLQHKHKLRILFKQVRDGNLENRDV